MLRTALAAICLTVVPSILTPAPASVDAYVERYRAATGLPGVAVAITKGGSVIHAAGYGKTATGEPVTADTPMAVASVSKSFTALAVMQLAEKGELALDQPVRRYLPEFTMADPRAAKITVRQLLDQTSGMADSAFREKSLPQPDTLQGAVARLRTAGLAAEPGTAFSYHNTNYQVAARLVEVVSGRPFAAYLAAHVFEPLGMRHSTTLNTDRDLPGTARGHLYVLGQALALPEPTGFGNGSGGVLSTAGDMARWLIAQNSGLPGLLSPRAVREMRTPSKPNKEYALGWYVGRTERGTPVLEHGGDLFTSTAHQVLMPDSGYGIAVMANTGMAFSDAHALMTGIIAIIEGGTPRPPSTQSLVLTDALFALLTLVTVGLAARGTVRARRWAARRRGWQLWRLAPYLVPIALCATIAPIHRVLARGRDAAWIQLAYLYPTFMIWLVTAAAAGLTVVAARLWGTARLRRR
ncbi:serine hydrolase domain-containing protein [Nonomuraea pusilla]|uniref:CubicO group peptidase, beta-lactamase class C family n=1 Tax=Nonomuraea pusilla TaxID=46177 RepID=A0A1H8GR93_9ACTN|nr:serine hydrolase domain-containing protein [Nonomuraea pusilla]SEN46340.1 CubicO group peptidase, beta-lactamase class C family [Nonomuraea pusilla]